MNVISRRIDHDIVFFFICTTLIGNQGSIILKHMDFFTGFFSSVTDFILINVQLSCYSVTTPSLQRRQWHPTPVLLPGKSHGERSLVGCSPLGHEELDTTERLHFHSLEKEMATHSSVLAWRIPGMGEPGGLLSMGSHRV